MNGDRAFFITTPIYYVNDKPHIGHAYTTLACDVLARFKRLDGFKVKFLTGTDEHGQKVEKSAQTFGVTPGELADKNSVNFRNLAQALNCTYDDFIRTSEQRHIKASQALWDKLVANGQIYLDDYAGWYSVRDEAFYGEDEITIRPDGSRFATPTGAPVEWVKEPSYFFRLSDWTPKLLELYENNPNFIAPQGRRNEVLAFVKSGLQDLSVSRTSFTWGIPVPGDDKHVMYVWLDALTNYITALGYPEMDGEMAEMWPANLHMVGKDIVRFHAIYWPAFLMAADLPPPQRVFAHGWWTNEGQKISKSVGNVIDPIDLIAKYGLDQVRYFLLREIPFGSDGDYSHRAMMGRMNSELANDYGNLAQRTLSMIFKNCNGAIPEPGELNEDDHELLNAAYGLLDKNRDAMDRQAFHEALEAIWVVVRAANGYVDRQAPWGLKKNDPARMGTVLWVLAETIRAMALLTQAFMPDSSAKLLDQLAVPSDQRRFAHWGRDYALKGGTSISQPAGLFPRYVEEESDAG